jgi:drug/metabolite transporter (DMT)-like permease
MISAADWALLAVSFIWGGAFVVVKEALAGVSPLLFLALRFSAAAVLLAILLRKRLSSGPALAWCGDWRGGLTAGTLLFLGYALQTAGLEKTTASRSAFLTSLYIVLVPLLAAFVKQGRPRPVEIAGVSLAAAGTAILTTQGANWARGSWSLNPGDALTVMSALAFAGHILAVAHYSRSMSYERLALYQISGVALISWLSLPTLETPRIVWSRPVIGAIAATALLATTLAFLLYTWAQRHTSATRAALIFATEPIFAGLIAWRWPGENWSVESAVGAALILSGIVLVELKPGSPGVHQLD